MADDRPRSDGAPSEPADASDDRSGTAPDDQSGTAPDEYDPFSEDSFSDDEDSTGESADAAAESPATEGASTDAEEGSDSEAVTESGSGRDRTVVVPTDVYKRVTVFSTLFAVVAVVGGFLLLDSATERASRPLSETDPVLALAGLGLIALGAVTYAFSTRFQAEGMGNAKDEADEVTDDG